MADTTFESEVRQGDLAYALPTTRPASPAESINTVYGPDETDPEDHLLLDEQFEQKMVLNIRINEPTEIERWNEAMPIRYPNVRAGSQEEISESPHAFLLDIR
jgi:hypothetical protein